MNEIEEFLEKYNKPLTHEQVKSVIYNAFSIIIFLIPILPEIIGFGVYSFKNTIFNLATIVTSIVLLILNIKNIKTVKFNIYEKILSVYLLLVSLSTIFTKFGIDKAILGSNGRGEGLITIFSYIATFVIFCRGYKHIIKTVKVALVGAIIVSIYAFIQANVPVNIELPFDPNRVAGVARGTMKNQNLLSSYICIFLPAMCYYYINSKEHKSLIVIVLLFAALVYSVTLGGYITFTAMYIAVILVSIYFSKDRKNTLIRIGISIGTILAILFILKLGNNDVYFRQISESKQEVVNLAKGSDNFGSGRMEIWRKTIAAIKNNAWLGVGPDSLAKEFKYGNYVINGDKDILNRYIVDKAHSEPLHMAATTGVPSAIVYLLFATILVIKLLIIVIKNIKQKGIKDKHTVFMSVILVSILSYLMQSMINFSVVQVAPVFWAILGIGAGITLNENND